mgnify:CR=1 FL=1
MDFKEQMERDLEIEHQNYMRKLEYENRELKYKFDSLMVNLHIIATLTSDEKTSAVINDVIKALGQGSAI